MIEISLALVDPPAFHSTLDQSDRNSINCCSAYNCPMRQSQKMFHRAFFRCCCSLCIANSLQPPNILLGWRASDLLRCFSFHATINPGAHTSIFISGMFASFHVRSCHFCKVNPNKSRAHIAHVEMCCIATFACLQIVQCFFCRTNRTAKKFSFADALVSRGRMWNCERTDQRKSNAQWVIDVVVSSEKQKNSGRNFFLDDDAQSRCVGQPARKAEVSLHTW